MLETEFGKRKEINEQKQEMIDVLKVEEGEKEGNSGDEENPEEPIADQQGEEEVEQQVQDGKLKRKIVDSEGSKQVAKKLKQGKGKSPAEEKRKNPKKNVEKRKGK